MLRLHRPRRDVLAASLLVTDCRLDHRRPHSTCDVRQGARDDVAVVKPAASTLPPNNQVRELQLQMGIDSGDLVRFLRTAGTPYPFARARCRHCRCAETCWCANSTRFLVAGQCNKAWAGGAAGCLHLFEGRPCAEGHAPSVKTSSRVPPGHTQGRPAKPNVLLHASTTLGGRSPTPYASTT